MDEPIILERTFSVSADKVWKALADGDELRKWYFPLEKFKPEVGFKFQFWAGDDKKKWLHLCKVTDVVPGKKIAYSWRYDGYAGDSLVTFELFPEGGKTRLKLTHAGIETFPADVPELAKKNFVAGWTHIIGKSLEEFLQRPAVESK